MLKVITADSCLLCIISIRICLSAILENLIIWSQTTGVILWNLLDKLSNLWSMLHQAVNMLFFVDREDQICIYNIGGIYRIRGVRQSNCKSQGIGSLSAESDISGSLSVKSKCGGVYLPIPTSCLNCYINC